MGNNYQPALVVVAFNRINSLARILRSLDQASYPANTTLVISIDNNGTNQDVADFANAYIWKFGEKKVIYHPERLGLRNHVIKCGDLVNTFGSVIILEDDLFLSPVFYEYALEAINFYAHDNRIAGISLYSLPYSETSKLPFASIDDDSSVFFKQMPASLGQVWTKEQWTGFRNWYETDPDLNTISGIPEPIMKWPEHSWKRYFTAYVVKFNKYFVFPRYSFSTTFPDIGTNMVTRSFYLQAPLKLKLAEPVFKELDDAVNVYDVFAELLPDRLNRLTSQFKDYDYETDLYGWKTKYNKPYVLTSRACSDALFSFDRTMKPHEMNVIMNIKGDLIHFVKSENVTSRSQNLEEFLEEQTYFHRSIYKTPILLKILKRRLLKKLKRKG